jgi:Fe-S-cluster-containing dehydrogenase component
LLYDATRCIGCKSCMVACREANGLPLEVPGSLYDAPVDLSPGAKTVVKLQRRNGEFRFIKAQCMHCVDPGCASACMLGALHKRERDGIVAYDPGRCIGCRYCQIACPFNVPRFEWASATPKIVKCELCRHRLDAGGAPACTAVCPREAVVFGKRAELLDEARQRLARHPERYVPTIYGETEGGGTQVLLLSSVPFTELGLPDLGPEAAAQLSESLQHGVYKGFVVPASLYALLGAVMLRHRRRASSTEGEAP